MTDSPVSEEGSIDYRHSASDSMIHPYIHPADSTQHMYTDYNAAAAVSHMVTQQDIIQHYDEYVTAPMAHRLHPLQPTVSRVDSNDRYSGNDDDLSTNGSCSADESSSTKSACE